MSYDRGRDRKPRSWKEKSVLREVMAGFPDAHKLDARCKLGSGRGF
jgi:hypothetical protein